MVDKLEPKIPEVKRVFKVKKQEVNGKIVDVETKHLEIDGVVVLHVKAIIEGVEYSEPFTVGAADGTGIQSYTAEHLQKDLDRHRDKCAKAAELKHRLQTMVSNIE